MVFSYLDGRMFQFQLGFVVCSWFLESDQENKQDHRNAEQRSQCKSERELDSSKGESVVATSCYKRTDFSATGG